MTQEGKELFLKDICARTFYNVKVFVPIMSFVKGEKPYTEPIELVSVNAIDETCTVGDKYAQTSGIRMFTKGGELICKPYLRPMSSMTEEEKWAISSIVDEFGNKWFDAETTNEKWFATFWQSAEIVDYLNSHHFDFRGLIEKGLAIAVTEENNPYKE